MFCIVRSWMVLSVDRRKPLAVLAALTAVASGACVVGGRASAATAVGFVPLDAPARLLDTRPGEATADGQGAGAGPIGRGSTTVVHVAPRLGVPESASSVVLNVTVTAPTAAGFVTVFPCGQPRPLASNLNFAAGQTIPNLVIARVGAGGDVCLFTELADPAGTAHLIADIAGYFPPAAGMVPLEAPARLLDTRPGEVTADGQDAGAGPVGRGSTTVVQVAPRLGVPESASSVVLNVTVTAPSSVGFVTVFPCGQPRPVASNLNFAAGQTIPNLVIAKVGDGGQVCLFLELADPAGTAHLIADVAGYFTASARMTPLDAPARLLDTRPGEVTADGQGAGAGPVGRGSTTVVHVAPRLGVPESASSVVLNVTVTAPTAAGFVTVFPCGQPQPLASNLNFAAGQTIPNSVIARVGAGGDVCLFTELADPGGTAHLIADIAGYFTIDLAGPDCHGLQATIVGTPGNDILTGTEGNDVFLAGAGDDQLIAGGGDDVLCGEDGGDLLVPGAGLDQVDGGAGPFDMAVYFDAPGPVTVDLTQQVTAGNGGDTLTGIEGAAGGAGDDVLIGGSGDELFLGYLGADTIDAGAGFDVLLVLDAEAPDGVFVDLLFGEVFGAGGDSVASLEGAVGTSGPDEMWGGSGADMLIGAGGDDFLAGDSGGDVLLGGDGDDELYGDDSDDYLDGGPGDDLLDGGAGTDLVDFPASPAIYVDLHPASAYADDDDDGFIDDSVYEVEAVSGTPGDDVVLGTDGVDYLLGKFGNDELWGRDGDDVLTLYGTGSIYGGAGEDRCSGGVPNECELSSEPPSAPAQLNAGQQIENWAQSICAQCILGNSTLGGTQPLDWWVTYPFGRTYCVPAWRQINLELPQNPVRDFAARSNSIELWVELHVWTGSQWVWDSHWHYMYWDPNYRQFNISWPLGTFLNPQTDIGGWRYFNGAPVGRDYAIPINPGYTVQVSLIVRWTDWNGNTYVRNSWPSAGPGSCTF